MIKIYPAGKCLLERFFVGKSRITSGNLI